MAKKSVKLYTDDVLKQFYDHLLDGNLKNLHIPHSDVFYVRTAIEADTGVRYTLDHVERAMYLEGYLTRYEVLDPGRKRDNVG